jgi:hypothetical protein
VVAAVIARFGMLAPMLPGTVCQCCAIATTVSATAAAAAAISQRCPCDGIELIKPI